MSRRFLDLFAKTSAPPPRRRRPPGAVDEARFLELCTACDECIEACPHGAILKYAPHASGALPGTPVMRPEIRACHMCPSGGDVPAFPCAAACREGALRPIPEGSAWQLGVVRIVHERCIPFRGPAGLGMECGACSGVCPDGAPALKLIRDQPVIDEDVCLGCGLCIELCVVDPKAIVVAPLA